MKINHNFFSNLAFNLAEKNLGRTGNNPSVGCVVVKNNSVVSSGSTSNVYTGLEKPTVNYGYRIHIQLKASGEIFCIRNAVMSAHSTSLSADGITEETLEFVSHVDPKIVTSAHVTLTPEADL